MGKGLRSNCIVFLLIVCLGFCAAIANAVEVEEAPVYVINPGDQLLITVVGHEQELTSLVEVRRDGMITYPRVGDIKVVGLTTAELSSLVSERLSEMGFYKTPQVTVQVRYYKRETIYVFGAVSEPGQKRFLEPASVIEVLGTAGGYDETADLAAAKILRNRNEVIPVDLDRLLRRNILDEGVADNELLDEKFIMKDGDVLIIPSAIRNDRISVIGHVNLAGNYRIMKPAVTIMEALALANGHVEQTADLKHIRIIKAGGRVYIVDATLAWSGDHSSQLPPETENTADSAYQNMVQPGDSVFVPEKGKVGVIGSVKNQGFFAIDDEINVIQVLTLAGVEDRSNLKKLTIVRSNGEQVSLDVSDIWNQPGQEADQKMYVGDTLIVPRTFSINWSAISTVVLLFSTLYAIFK